MNILTFDIEEWYLARRRFGYDESRYQGYDNMLSNILDSIDSTHQKATFFCVGGMAREFPDVVRKIYDRGHEIGCHSDKHVWLNKMTREEVLEDTRCAVDSLEQCIGSKVLSYRAPAFSIGNSNKWAFEVLASCGIERDASIFPAVRDFGGFAEFGQKTPTLVKCNGMDIHEFPICTARILGREVAYSGGGYFRFFPLWFLENTIGVAEYNMCYFHIVDLISGRKSGILSKSEYEKYYKEEGTIKNRLTRYVKNNIGNKGAWEKLVAILSKYQFTSVEHADTLVDWNNCNEIAI